MFIACNIIIFKIIFLEKNKDLKKKPCVVKNLNVSGGNTLDQKTSEDYADGFAQIGSDENLGLNQPSGLMRQLGPELHFQGPQDDGGGAGRASGRKAQADSGPRRP